MGAGIRALECERAFLKAGWMADQLSRGRGGRECASEAEEQGPPCDREGAGQEPNHRGVLDAGSLQGRVKV